MKRNGYGWVVAAAAILAAAIWLPRGFALDRLVTPDEPTWLTNSANFYAALAHGDLGHTYQIEHPGVTTMWIGTAAFLWRYPNYPNEGPGQVAWWEEEVSPYLQARGHEPLELLEAGRSIMGFAILLVLLAAFWAAVRLLGVWPALFGFLLIAADPFHIAHSRLLHLDGLASSLVLLALLAFLNYLYRGGRTRDLVVSAAAAGLAWLTKSPTLFLIPFVGLLLLIELVVQRRRAGRFERRDYWRAGRPLIAWGAVGLAVFVLLWPAMWVDPLYTIWRVLRATVGYAAAGHEAALYFNGAIVEGDPGLLFYPITYLWRTTPFVLAGLALAVAAFGFNLFPEQRRPLAALLLFAALFTLFMTLGAKKFDRYLLPVYLPLNLVAGVGWATAARRLQHWPRRLAQVAAPAILLLVLAGQSSSAISAFPYYLSYYNPLLGGTAEAPEVMMVGWGEGLDQAARYLNSRPGAENLQVATGVWNGSFSYFFKGRVQWSVFDPETSLAQEWAAADYCVVYINQWQRGRLPQELLDYLDQMTPALSVRLQGLEYVRVYDLRGVPPPGYLVAKGTAH